MSIRCHDNLLGNLGDSVLSFVPLDVIRGRVIPHHASVYFAFTALSLTSLYLFFPGNALCSAPVRYLSSARRAKGPGPEGTSSIHGSSSIQFFSFLFLKRRGVQPEFIIYANRAGKTGNGKERDIHTRAVGQTSAYFQGFVSCFCFAFLDNPGG